ncbi:MAG: sigma-70 family RNA polymerase sigma factor [Hyphomonas sp.]|nr:sigma-70 family RNA polymerase sigma factor [Hyphomonas sp.]
MNERASFTGLALLIRPAQVDAALWRRCRQEGDSAARETLFERHKLLARQIAGSEYFRRPPYGLERADFEQLAFAGLIEAIDRYDPLRGVPFEAFARYRIAGAISSGIGQSSEGAAQYTFRRRTELDRLRTLKDAGESLPDDPLAELTDLVTGLALGFMLEEVARLGESQNQGPADAWQSGAWRDLLLSLRRALDSLPLPEKTIIRQHYFEGVAFLEIAALLELSRGRVSQLHRAALERLRNFLGPSG